MARMKLFLIGIALVGFVLAGAGPALAHDETIDTEFLLSGIGENNDDWLIHDDQDDWKGFLTITATNTGSEAWGDFHFLLFDSGYGDSVFFTDALGQNVSSQGGTAIITDGHHLDFYFYDNPVTTGNSATFTVYTDNTADHLSSFGVGFYATPVPVPGALILFGSGLLGLIGIRRRLR